MTTLLIAALILAFALMLFFAYILMKLAKAFEAFCLEDMEPSKREALEMENTEFDYGHNVEHNTDRE